MLKSMTGYGSAETATETYQYKVELKSLNGKFLELNLRMPKRFGDKELGFRNYINTQVIRGSVSIFINIEKQKNSESGNLVINKALASEYYKNWIELAVSLGAETKEIFSVLMANPDLIETENQKYEESEWNQLMLTFEKAFQNFEAFRVDEGKTLFTVLTEHCKVIKHLIPEIEMHEAERFELTKQRLQKNLSELISKEGYDKNRFEQEMIYYLERLDITEEKNRLISHCDHFIETLNEEQNGRKLNFIAQEMGREINTMGSKAGHAAMQKTVVKMKEELERIKEQVLNVL